MSHLSVGHTLGRPNEPEHTPHKVSYMTIWHSSNGNWCRPQGLTSTCTFYTLSSIRGWLCIFRTRLWCWARWGTSFCPFYRGVCFWSWSHSYASEVGSFLRSLSHSSFQTSVKTRHRNYFENCLVQWHTMRRIIDTPTQPHVNLSLRSTFDTGYTDSRRHSVLN